MYATPRTPSTASSAHLYLSNGNRDSTVNSRKRPRSDYFSPPNSSTSPYAHSPHARSNLHATSPAPSPAPLANSRYALLHGVDTPGLAHSDAQSTPFDDLHCRRNILPTTTPTPLSPISPSQDFITAAIPNPLAHERNGAPRKRPRMGSAHSTPETWGNYMWRLTTTAAKGVWNFCSTTRFHGFSAGGGQPYTLNAHGPPSMFYPDRASTPVPGTFPVDDDYTCVSAERPAKRHQVSHAGEWVVINRPPPCTTPPLQRSSSRSFLPRPTRTASGSKRPTRASLTTRVSSASPRAHTAASPAQPTQRCTASTASMRSPSPVSACRPGLTHGRPFTPIQTAAPHHRDSPQDAAHRPRTPSSTETIAKYTAARHREAKKQEKSMRKMNRQLKDLIRMGEEALASRFSLGDDGHVDEEGEGGSEVSWDSGVDLEFEEEEEGEGDRTIGLGGGGKGEVFYTVK